MAEVLNEEQLKNVVSGYLNKLSSSVSIDKAIVYGSYARGTATEWSDIDLFIISKDLPENRSKGLNGLYLDRIVKEFDLRLEVIGIHPSNLNDEITKGFFKEIIETGKVFYPLDVTNKAAA